MTRPIPKPSVGIINSIEFAEIDELTQLVHEWRKQMNQARSPVQGVVHKSPDTKPLLPSMSPIPFKYAAILPLMQGMFHLEN